MYTKYDLKQDLKMINNLKNYKSRIIYKRETNNYSQLIKKLLNFTKPLNNETENYINKEVKNITTTIGTM